MRSLAGVGGRRAEKGEFTQALPSALIMNENNGQPGFLGSILGWFAHPFQSQGSAFNWVLFVGLLIVAAWFWQWTLLQITTEG